MINHARTLLLNRNGDGYGGTLGDEYVPPEFPAIALPGYLNKLRIYLFSTDPDQAFMNYRLQQYMAVLHSSPLVEFVTDLDSRITYDVDNQEMFADSNYGLTETEYLFFVNELGPPDATGRSFHKWRIRRLNAATISVTRVSPPQSVVIHPYTIANGISNILPLPGSEASFRFRASLPNGVDQRVEGYARPEMDTGAITASLRGTGSALTINLFGVGTPLAATEPFKTFRNLWNNHPELAYQLGGLLLAVIYQTERERTGNG